MMWAEEQGQIKAGVGPFLDRMQRERQAYVFRRVFPTRGDKAVRAQSIRGRMALEGLYLPTGAAWVPAFRSELLSFPAGKHDDQVDALGLVGQLLDRILPGQHPKPPEIKKLIPATGSLDRTASLAIGAATDPRLTYLLSIIPILETHFEGRLMLTKLRCDCCDRELSPSKTGRPKRFCSSRCRTATNRVSLHDGGQNGLRYRTGLGSPKSAFQETDPQQEFLSRNSISKKHPLRFERVNEVTWKLTDGEGSNVPARLGFWGGYRTSRAVAWVMSVAPGKWLARYRDQCSGPSGITQATRS